MNFFKKSKKCENCGQWSFTEDIHSNFPLFEKIKTAESELKNILENIKDSEEKRKIKEVIDILKV